MPGLITHLLSGQEILTRLPKNIADDIRKYRPLYNIGCQGPDIFFYYIPGYIRKSSRNIGNIMHKEGSGLFIKAMSKNLKNLKNDEKDAVFAYFAGFLAHYILDCTAHPYIYYKTGFDADGKLSGKFSAYHVAFESSIDTLLLKYLKGKRPSDIKWWRTLAGRRHHAQTASKTIACAINQAYSTTFTSRQISSALVSVSIASKILRSPHGYWKSIVAYVERVLLPRPIASPLIHQDKIESNIDYLNLSRTPWKNPWDENSHREESFKDLFMQAADEAAKLIHTLYKCTYGNLPLETFLNQAGNRCFNSGCPLDQDSTFRFHDAIYRKK
ncbi:MAG: zinc dependent phospholipase C family protein [Defluviitaleaceae bacterium]|nr:zinc dependent phospholipase C family protein [Defluviitaleaceae bacterium]